MAPRRLGSWLLALPVVAWVSLSVPASAGQGRVVKPTRAQGAGAQRAARAQRPVTQHPARGRAVGSKKRNALTLSAKSRHPQQKLTANRKPLTVLQTTKALARITSRQQGPVPLSKLQGGMTRYRSVVTRVRAVKARDSSAVKVSRLGKADGLTVQRVDLIGPRPIAGKRPRVLIVGGLHAGTEVVGAEAATQFIELASGDAKLRNRFDITVVPLLNPGGMVLGTRRNARGEDPNRGFTSGSSTPSSRMIRQLIKSDQFDMVIDLHGGGHKRTTGFFIIRGDKDPSMANRILSTMPTGQLHDVPGASGRPTSYGPYTFSHLGNGTSQSVGTLKSFMAEHGVKHSFTFEAPTRTEPKIQVQGTLRMIHSALHHLGVESR